jgi:precorrin-2 C(20)-methyltransferase
VEFVAQGSAMSDLGTFFGVGLGPGDPELVTPKAVRILMEVDWIFLPAGKKLGAGFARRIIAPLGLPEAKFRPVSLCMARSRQEDVQAYCRVAREILGELERGRSVAWIAEGDPLFYSTFGHILEEVRDRCPAVPVQIVPGVTSLQAASASAAMPVASLDDKVAVLPAAYGLERLPSLVNEFASVFLIKVHSVFDQLLDHLAELPSVHAVYLENVGMPAERLITDLESLRGNELPYFSLVMLRKRQQGADAPRSPGTIFVVGLGPGRRDLLTGQARQALADSQVIVGYSGYFAGIDDLVQGKECHRFELGRERERACLALELASQGKSVAVISSGDPGIYAMAGIVLEALECSKPACGLALESDREAASGKSGAKEPEVIIVPGISAVNAAAALLGAPLGHDFAVISLSDLLTPWEIIEKRLHAAAQADFVIALVNPKSKERHWQLAKACEILLKQRNPDTSVGIVRNAFRPGQAAELTTLKDLSTAAVDMFTTVIVGNSQTRRFGPHMITPREMSRARSASEGESKTLACASGSEAKIKPNDILQESFRIIEREVGPHPFSAEEWPVVRRMIHACGDLELVHAIQFHQDAVGAGIEALRNHTPLITDVNMVAAGINKAALQEWNIAVHCFVDDAEIREQARQKQTTRSACAMHKALGQNPEGIYVIGNAPTALAAVCEAVRNQRARPRLLLAMPVGFVGVLESKAQAMKLDVPVIIVQGRKGGSALAAAAINALLHMASREQ